jgi:hypothetical protein
MGGQSVYQWPTTTFAAAAVSSPVNTRLVAAVQTRAGARCHQSANLLSAYYLSADVYRKRCGRGDDAAASAAWRTFKQAEIQLRHFLTDLFDPCGGAADAGMGLAAMAS